MPTPAPAPDRSTFGLAAAMLLAVVVYLPGFAGELIWDDVIVFQQHLPAFRRVGDVFFPPAGIHEWGWTYYRPLVTASYLIDRAIFGEGWWGHHLTVIAFHAAATLAVGLLARRLLQVGAPGAAGRSGAVATAMFFAVHPLHVDSVAQITGRCDPMAAAFSLWALLVLAAAADRPTRAWPWIVSPVLWLCGLLSKEAAVAALPVGALLIWLLHPKARWGRFAVGHGLAAIVYLALRSAAGTQAPEWRELGSGAAIERLLRGVGYHVSHSLWPWPQRAFVTMEQLPSAWLGGAAVVLLGAWALIGWSRRARHPALPVAAAWFLMTLVPVLGVLWFRSTNQPVAERWLYLPSVGVALMCGWGVAALWPRANAPRLIAGIGALAVVVLGAATVARVAIYRDPETFWTDVNERTPGQALPLYQLAVVRRRAGQLDEAEPMLRRAIELYDDSWGRALAQTTLGTIHLERRELDAAEQAFTAAIAERPDYATAHFNLASVYGMRAQAEPGAAGAALFERAVGELQRALELRPDYPQARSAHAQQGLRLAEHFKGRGQHEECRRVLAAVLASAQWLVQRGDTERARDAGRRVLERVQQLDR